MAEIRRIVKLFLKVVKKLWKNTQMINLLKKIQLMMKPQIKKLIKNEVSCDRLY